MLRAKNDKETRETKIREENIMIWKNIIDEKPKLIVDEKFEDGGISYILRKSDVVLVKVNGQYQTAEYLELRKLDSDIICEETWFFRGYNDSAASGEYIQANDRWTYIIE